MTEKVLIFIRTKRYFLEAKYWFVDAVVRGGSGDIVITREAHLPERASDEELAAEIAAWYGVPKDAYELAELKDLNNPAPILAVDSPQSVPVKQPDAKPETSSEALAKARAEKE